MDVQHDHRLGRQHHEEEEHRAEERVCNAQASASDLHSESVFTNSGWSRDEEPMARLAVPSRDTRGSQWLVVSCCILHLNVSKSVFYIKFIQFFR